MRNRLTKPILLLACLLVAGCGDSDSTAIEPPPNIVFVFADDLGYGDLSSYGNREIDTPNLDRIAAEGARFTEFYVGSSVCSPSRASLLTGRYPIRMRMSPLGVFFPFSTSGLEPAEVTIAEVLRDRGYATALVGKWHLGHLPQFLPTQQGFDEFYGLPYSNDMEEPQYPGEKIPERPCNSVFHNCRPGVPLMEGTAIVEMPAIQETLTQRYAARAVEFIRQSVEGGRPFFLYYASNFPHVPLYASDDFRGTSRGGLYGDVVEELDWSVGEILDELRTLDIERNTLVIFSSDNGPWLLWATNNDVPQGGQDSGTAAHLRNGKSTTFEGGMRVPLVARWPARIPAGRTITQPAAMIDWMPTLAAFAGADIPEGVDIDGSDIGPLLTATGERDPLDGFRYLYYRQDNSRVAGYREGRWKLKLAVEGGESVYARYDHDDLLFDLESDPSEENDLAADQPERLAAMKQRMNELAALVPPATTP